MFAIIKYNHLHVLFNTNIYRKIVLLEDVNCKIDFSIVCYNLNNVKMFNFDNKNLPKDHCP